MLIFMYKIGQQIYYYSDNDPEIMPDKIHFIKMQMVDGEIIDKYAFLYKPVYVPGEIIDSGKAFGGYYYFTNLRKAKKHRKNSVK